MSPCALLRAARAAGVRITADGADLLIEADAPPPDALLDAIRASKPALLALLGGREPSVAVAVVPHVEDDQSAADAALAAAAGNDWPVVQADPALRQALVQALHARMLRAHGAAPPGWTAVVECAQCGPVYLWPGLPISVAGCPWCFNRLGGAPIPRPRPVNCATCRHFRRGAHPHLGRCALGEPQDPAGLWDTDRRGCGRWLPRLERTGE